MTRVDVHVVKVQPHGAWARWVCTCGRRSRLFGYLGYAEGAGRAHAKATGGRLIGDRRYR